MRTVLVLAAVVALALAGPAPTFHKDISQIKVENVDATIVEHQYKVLELLDHVNQVNTEATYYKVGKAYDIQAHVDKYKKPEVVSNFYSFYENGMVPKYYQFTIFNDNMREQAKAFRCLSEIPRMHCTIVCIAMNIPKRNQVIDMQQRVGDRTEPWGTPEFTDMNRELLPSVRTRILRSCRKSATQEQNWAGRPYAGSLERRLLCQTLSNALAMSRLIANDSPRLSIASP
ncbi:hypothetical protein evm_014805 [Chilo suppressalis]|nr:hypothetical protein evm_014805 [Chilo suppressalis]